MYARSRVKMRAPTSLLDTDHACMLLGRHDTIASLLHFQHMSAEPCVLDKSLSVKRCMSWLQI